MASLYQECKKWINCTQQLDFETVIEILQNKTIKPDAESDKVLFKLLLHLSHSADRCRKEKLSKEIQIFTVANWTCKNLTSVSDKNKLFSAIYYILLYLLNKQLFGEAKIITSYLFPGKIIAADDLFESSQYFQIGSLWFHEIFKKLEKETVNSMSLKANDSKDLTTYIQFHFQILNFCDENSSYSFVVFDSYMKRFSEISLAIASPYMLQLFKEISNCISNLKKFPVIDAYNIIIPAIGISFYKRKDAINNKIILECFQKCDSYLLESLKVSTQCYDSYKLFREYSLNIFETNFMSKETGHKKFKKTFEILISLLKKYGINNDSMTNTVTGLACSFEILFSNWERLVSEQLINTKITYDDILQMGKFVKCAFDFLKNRTFPSKYTCKKCSNIAKCSMKKDIYNAALAAASYLRLVSKFNANNLNEKIFMITKNLIEEMILVYYEIKKSGCKYTMPMWDMCGRTIFNIGLISESVYPAQFEKLYEVLCKHLIEHDGLTTKESSFGLDSPVGSTLQRLCNVNFSQDNYRKAMSYTAYNALLSVTENRRKKAYDMWCTIKLKCLDSKEIQELTIVKCLQTDTEIAKNVGINVNLEDYDLTEVYIQELKVLFPAKGNLSISMQNILAQLLESTNNALYYARGVLMLCFHSLQHSKRKYIAKYISKAIEKLSRVKPRTLENQCLLANLNFFNILEKLYARRQAITKQMDDANFTIKSFKTLSGKYLEDQMKEQDEIVPTYGNINIEEDNTCAKELRDVLIIWQKCIQTDLIAIIKGWEPEFTLETIVICSEYCRLFQFKNIEEMSWEIAYKLATGLQNFPTCIYVTGRSISLRSINDQWIRESEKYVEQLRNSSKKPEIDNVILFWLSLADFYLDCKRIEEAKVLLDKAKAMPNLELINNSKMVIYASDIQLRHYFVLNHETSQKDYCQLLVQIHYMLINLHDILDQDICKFWNIRYQLFALEQMFEAMYNITIPMFSLLSHREILGHLTYGLKFAQKLGLTLRIAQYLKYYCYIALLRAQTEEVETKLQDLEHILCLEQFQMSMNAHSRHMTNNVIKQAATTHKVRNVNGIVIKNGGSSPELKRKIFSTPNFLTHETNCQCFTCTHTVFQYLTFSSSYIRAHLYSILSYVTEAEQYFHGACLIKMRLNEIDSDTLRQQKQHKWKRHQSIEIDELLYMLEFSIFITDFVPEKKDSAIAIIEEALESSKINGLDKHPVGVYALELYQQHYVYEVLAHKLCIQSEPEIPITITNQSVSGCITPKHQVERVTRNLRRRRSPPAIGIPVITIEEPVTTKDPVAESANDVVVKQKRTNPKIVRRKLLVDEVDEGQKEENQQSVPIRRSTRLASQSEKNYINDE